MQTSRLFASLLVTAWLSGCTITLKPDPVELPAPAAEPLLRLVSVSERLTGTWAEAAQRDGNGVKEHLEAALRGPEGAGHFTTAPDHLAMTVELATDHVDDGPRLFGLGALSICTLGLLPLSYDSVWRTTAQVRLVTPDGTAAGEFTCEQIGRYDIFAYPLTMFSLFGASTRGPEDGREIMNRIGRGVASQILAWVEADRERLAPQAHRKATEPRLPAPALPAWHTARPIHYVPFGDIPRERARTALAEILRRARDTGGRVIDARAGETALHVDGAEIPYAGLAASIHDGRLTEADGYVVRLARRGQLLEQHFVVTRLEDAERAVDSLTALGR